jgi:hypothetical protein
MEKYLIPNSSKIDQEGNLHCKKNSQLAKRLKTLCKEEKKAAEKAKWLKGEKAALKEGMRNYPQPFISIVSDGICLCSYTEENGGDRFNKKGFLEKYQEVKDKVLEFTTATSRMVLRLKG